MQYCLANPINQSEKLWLSIKTRDQFAKSQLNYMLYVQTRFDSSSPYFQENIFRGGLGLKKSNKFSLWLGYEIDPKQNLRTRDMSVEQRIWQQTAWETAIAEGIDLKYRSRLEARFESSSNYTAYRLRQRLSFDFKNNYNKFYPYMYEELFFNLNHPAWVSDRVLSQNRLLLGIKIPRQKQYVIEIGYLNKIQLDRNINRMNHILNLSLKLL